MSLLLASPSHGQSSLTLDDALNNKGFHAERNYFSPEPFEHYDTLSGNLILTFTDLVLPGNAGRDLRFQRTFNNQSFQTGFAPDPVTAQSRWTFGFPGVVMRVFERAVPPNPNFNTIESTVSTTPSFVMADGSWLRTIYTGNPTAPGAVPANMEVVSPGFYKYDRLNHSLRAPDGTIADYDLNTGRLVQFQDQFNNLVQLTWGAGSVVVTQSLGNGQSRQITLTLDDQARVTHMTYEGREWDYQYEIVFEDKKDITHVTTPEGLAWSFTYDDHSRDAAVMYEWIGLTSVITPNKGTIRYDYNEMTVCESSANPGCELRRLVGARHVEGPRGTTSGTWQIIPSYNGGVYGQHFNGETRIITPSQTRVDYIHVGTGNPVNQLAGRLVVGYRTIYSPAGQQFEQEQSFYVDLPVTLAADVPAISERRIIRNGRTFKTEYTYDDQNFGDYHHPKHVVETGHMIRVTDYTYQHLAAPWIPGLVLSQQVQVGTETFKRRWTYDSWGFRTSEVGWYRPPQASDGIVTNFSRDTMGNVSSKWLAGRTPTI